MLIDINTYIGHWPFRQLRDNTCKDILNRMNEVGIDQSIVSNLNGIFYKDVHSANEELFEAIRASGKKSDRLVPLAVINPIYSGWKNDFRVATERFGMKGIRLHPQYHGYDLTNENCVTLVKMARDKGLPVMFSLRMVDSRPSSWMDISKEWALKDIMPIIKAVPDAKYAIVNVANNSQLNVYNKDEMELFRNTDLVMDTSGRMILNLGEMLRTYGTDKFAFGTHAPLLDHITGLLRIESLRPEEAIPQDKILLNAGNAKRIFSI